MNKFFIVFFYLVFLSEGRAMFKPSECVGHSFQGSFNFEKGPFGLLPVSMNLKKNRCILDIEYKYLIKTHWIVDLCREPVHLKKSSWNGDGFQIRKTYPCKEDTTYCQQVDELISNIENEALIYAKGERETLATDHGKFYCAYLLLKNYLKEGKVFSLTVPDSINIFEKTLLESFGQKAEIPRPVETPTPAASPTEQLKF